MSDRVFTWHCKCGTNVVGAQALCMCGNSFSADATSFGEVLPGLHIQSESERLAQWARDVAIPALKNIWTLCDVNKMHGGERRVAFRELSHEALEKLPKGVQK